MLNMPKEHEPRFTIPEPEVQVIAERRKNKRRQRYDTVPSGIDGIDLLVEPGTTEIFGPRQVLHSRANMDRIERGKMANAQAEIAKGEERGLARTSNYRGLESPDRNIRGTVTPSETNIYDPDKLKQSTGEYHKSLVREEGVLEITLPFGSDEDARKELESIAEEFGRILIESGRDPEEVSKYVQIFINQRLDEERLDELIKEGKIKLKPRTKRVLTNWSVKTSPIEGDTKPKRQRKLKPKGET